MPFFRRIDFRFTQGMTQKLLKLVVIELGEVILLIFDY